ncbi:MAG TPA: hypothetical protein VKE42_10870, partial [Candidatus Cybelea sp.]|nr:hypothetical protein [Candidatus Cybelea sp.]
GMLRDKDVAGVIARIGARVDRWHIGPTPGARGADSEWLASQVRAVLAEANQPDVVEHATLADAYAAALGEVDVDDRIIVFGSFTTVAEVMRVRASSPAGRDSKLQ